MNSLWNKLNELEKVNSELLLVIDKKDAKSSYSP